MNQPTKLRSCKKLVAVFAAALLLSGCVFYPHLEQRSAEFRGRVLDANTRIPIKGAKVYLSEAPQYPTHTDADGRFRMKARTQMFWGGNPAGGDWPQPKSSDWEISHPKYLSPGWHELPRDYSTGDIGDVLLKPKQSSVP